jgi:hypothetical protein
LSTQARFLRADWQRVRRTADDTIEPTKENAMNMVLLPSLMSLLAGVAILIWPRLLNYIVAFYLILFGLMGLIPALQMGLA